MNTLNLNLINAHSEYLVWLSPNGKYLFKTDYDILYAVDFELDSNPYFTAYWFNLTNLEHQSSPGDPKIPQTVICIIEEFFRQNPDILLYMCSTEGEQQAQRARLSCDGLMDPNRISTMWRVQWKYMEKIVGKNMWQLSCNGATLNFKISSQSLKRRRRCSTN